MKGNIIIIISFVLGFVENDAFQNKIKHEHHDVSFLKMMMLSCAAIMFPCNKLKHAWKAQPSSLWQMSEKWMVVRWGEVPFEQARSVTGHGLRDKWMRAQKCLKREPQSLSFFRWNTTEISMSAMNLLSSPKNSVCRRRRFRKEILFVRRRSSTKKGKNSIEQRKNA